MGVTPTPVACCTAAWIPPGDLFTVCPGLSPPVWYRYPRHTYDLSFASSTHALLGRVTLNLQWLAPSRYIFFLVLYAICLMTPACFVECELACVPTHGTGYVCSHTLDSDSLLTASPPGMETAWASDRKAIQRVVHTAQYITVAKLPAIQDLYNKRCQRNYSYS